MDEAGEAVDPRSWSVAGAADAEVSVEASLPAVGRQPAHGHDEDAQLDDDGSGELHAGSGALAVGSQEALS